DVPAAHGRGAGEGQGRPAELSGFTCRQETRGPERSGPFSLGGFAAIGGIDLAPDRAVAEAGDEARMSGDLGLAQPRRQRLIALARHARTRFDLTGDHHRLDLDIEAECRLAAADQLDID